MSYLPDRRQERTASRSRNPAAGGTFTESIYPVSSQVTGYVTNYFPIQNPMTTDDDLNDKAMKNQFGLTYHWWTWESKIESQLQEVDPNISFTRIAPPVGEDGKSGNRGVGMCLVL